LYVKFLAKKSSPTEGYFSFPDIHGLPTSVLNATVLTPSGHHFSVSGQPFQLQGIQGITFFINKCKAQFV
jgi:hypothetical protein